jgi:hypothetical protein
VTIHVPRRKDTPSGLLLGSTAGQRKEAVTFQTRREAGSCSCSHHSADFGCGLAAVRSLWRGQRIHEYRGDTLSMKDDRRARDPPLAAIVLWAKIGGSS